MTIKVITDGAEMRAFSRQQRRDGKTIGFVPTMGYLHDGHISLVLAAREKCDVAVASIYVNPTQFSKNEDFGVYPRSQEADLAALEAAGCAAVFMPRSLYYAPPTSAGQADTGMVVGVTEDADVNAHSTWVTVDYLSSGLCARSRPHFFRGVCTVVAKLFNIVEPAAAFFGKKDYQQWRVLERMVRDLDFPIEVVGMPIRREEDGLAMSSRNAMLTPDNRANSPCIYKALTQAREDIQAGRVADAEEIKTQIASLIQDGGGKMDYVEVVNAQTLQPLTKAGEVPTLIAVAAHFGSVRLIDNIDF